MKEIQINAYQTIQLTDEQWEAIKREVKKDE